MGSTATAANHGLGGSCGANRPVRFGLFRAFARGLRGILERSKRRQGEERGATERQGSMDTRVIDATGNLCDTRMLRGFHHRCEQVMNPGRRCVAVDLTNVTSADTKLVATLVILRQRAQSVGAPLELTVSSRVYDWITLCRVERLLQPRRARRRAAAQGAGGR